MPHKFIVFTRMPHNLIILLACHTTTWSYLEPQPWYLAGTFRALLGRNCNAGDTGDTSNAVAGAGDSGAVSSTSELCKSDNSDSLSPAPALAATLAATIAFAFAFAFALACSIKGANSLSNSEFDLLLDISWS
jgi:hypothetical protein